MRIGLLFSLTGPRSDMGSTIADGALLAASEINDAGGVLGEPLDIEMVDARSEITRAASGVRTLVTERHVDAIVGGYMSASRVAMLPVLRELDTLLLYPTYFEGGETDSRVFYCGASPNQYLPGYLAWIGKNLGHRIAVIGSDYVYPRVLAEQIVRTAPSLGLEIVTESLLPLGETDFTETVTDIADAGAEVVVCNLVGSDSTAAFYREAASTGLPIAATVTTGVDLRNMDPEVGNGHYMVASYLSDMVTPANLTYRASLSQFRGPVPSHAAQVSAYNAVHMLALAAEDAGSVSTADLSDSLTRVSFDGNPSGVPFRFQTNHYSVHPTVIGRAAAQDSGEADYKVLAEFPATLADPWWGARPPRESPASRNVSAR